MNSERPAQTNLISPNANFRARLSSSVPETDSLADSVDVPKVNLKLEIMMKKERQRIEEEANFTYKPTLFTNKKDPEGTPKENRFDKLYNDAMKRHLDDKLKVDNVEDKELTFAPRFSTPKSSRPTSRGHSRSSSRERGGAQGSVNESMSSEKLGTSIRSQKSSAGDENLTFRPSITPRAKSIERSHMRDVSERLYQQSQHLKEKLERKRSEAELKVTENCTFEPKLNGPKRSSSVNKAEDLVKRMASFEDQKKKKLEDAKKEQEELEKNKAPFRPQLITSKRPATPTKVPVYERLSLTPTKDHSQVLQESNAELTFKPQLISKRSPSPNNKMYGSIHEKLFQQGIARKNEVELELQQIKAARENECTFTPTINEGPKDDRNSEPVFHRLSTNIARDRLDQLKAELTKECTFKPELSEGTLKLTANKKESIDALYHRQVAEAKKIQTESEARHKEQEENKYKGLTFSPSLPESSVSMAQKRRASVTINNSIEGSPVPETIYDRLNTTSTTAFLAHHDDSISIQADKNVRKSMIVPKKELDQFFERISSPHKPEEHQVEEVKKVVLPEKDVDQIVNRLVNKRTKSFTLKIEPEEPPLLVVPDSPRVSQEKLELIIERLQTHTASSSRDPSPSTKSVEEQVPKSPRVSPEKLDILVERLRSPTASSSNYNLAALIEHEKNHNGILRADSFLKSFDNGDDISPTKGLPPRPQSFRLKSPSPSSASLRKFFPEPENSLPEENQAVLKSSVTSPSPVTSPLMERKNSLGSNSLNPTSPRVYSPLPQIPEQTPISPTPLPPAPPTTTFKLEPKSSDNYYDSFNQKLENSLQLLNQTTITDNALLINQNNVPASPEPVIPKLVLADTSNSASTVSVEKSNNSAIAPKNDNPAKRSARIVKPGGASDSSKYSTPPAKTKPSKPTTASKNSSTKKNSATKNSSTPVIEKKSIEEKELLTTTPLPKEAEEFINNIPYVDFDETVSDDED